MGSRDYLKLGDYNAFCDICAFKFKASELRRRWDGFMVCRKDFEPRPPQELIRGIKEDWSVPFTRPNVADTMRPSAATSVLWDVHTVQEVLQDFSGNTHPFTPWDVPAIIFWY